MSYLGVPFAAELALERHNVGVGHCQRLLNMIDMMLGNLLLFQQLLLEFGGLRFAVKVVKSLD